MFIVVVTMFIQSNVKKVGSKIYRSLLLVQNFREGAKIRHKTLANLTSWPAALVEGLRSLIKGEWITRVEDLLWKAGKNFGGLFVLRELAKELFIDRILGSSRKARLAMLLVLGRILTQGSRRHLTFWGKGQAVYEVLGLQSFDEDDLYETLDWLERNQTKMEDRWFRLRFKNQKVDLFLYDVTSSYLEGQCNELAEYGYNRDGKKGKKQIVIGLMTTQDGVPIAVEVFQGNTSDVTTVPAQIRKMAQRFGVSDVTLVGDRGMIKKIPITLLNEQGWHYITAITKSQIEGLVRKNIFQLGLFEEKLVEIIHEGVRYLLRRNPQRAEEIHENLGERMQKLKGLCEKLNEKLTVKPRASEESALKELRKKITRLNLDHVITGEAKGRRLELVTDEEAMKKRCALDGCYVIKTDLAQERMTGEEVHATYKDLAEVEWAFRTMKTGLLEIRPLYHRKANRTRACVFVAMLAYAISHHLWEKTSHMGKPLDHILSSLDQIQTKEIMIAGDWVPILPTHLREDQEPILKALQIKLPKAI